MEGKGVGRAATMGTQQHHSLTHRPHLLPHLEEQLGAGPVSLAVVRDAQGLLIWGPKCLLLIWLVCPCVQRLGVPHLCGHRHHWGPLHPQTHPVPGPTWTCPSVPTLPGQHTQPPVLEHGPHGTLLFPPGLSWAVAVEWEVGSGEGLGASLGALSLRAGTIGPLGTDTCHPPTPAPGSPQCPAGPWFGLEP